MKTIVAGAFRNESATQGAVDKLLVSGFRLPEIKIKKEMNLDELGVSTGDVVRARTREAWLGDFFRSLTGRDEPTILEKAFSRAMKKDHVILTVEAAQGERADLAAEILNRFSPLEPEELFNMSEVEAYFAKGKSDDRLSASGAQARSSAREELQELLKKRGMIRRGKVRIFPGYEAGW